MKRPLHLVGWLAIAFAASMLASAAHGQTTRPWTIQKVAVTLTDGVSLKTETVAWDTAAVPATQPAPKFVGVNMPSVEYFEESPYTDLIKSGKAWGTAAQAYAGNAPVDADGWPVVDAGTIFTEQLFPAGDYALSFDGRGSVACTWPGSIVNQQTTNDKTTATVRMVATTQPVSFSLWVNGTNQGFRNMKLLRPGTLPGQQFTDSIKRDIRRTATAIRFMAAGLTNRDAGNDNRPDVKTWADRAKPTDAQRTTRGMPLEEQVDLANDTDCDMQIHIPLLADDDYVRQAVALVRARLRTPLVCYVTLSNEVWNGQFRQYHQNIDLARADPKFAGAMNDYYRGWWRCGDQCVRLHNLIGPDDRFRVVLETQLANPDVLKEQLAYIQRTYGPPSKFIYAAAGAPYFSPGKSGPGDGDWYTKGPVTYDGLITRFLGNCENAQTEPLIKALPATCAKYGIVALCYECGPDYQQYDSDVALKVASQSDPWMSVAVEREMRAILRSGYTGAFYFHLRGRWTRFGGWGASQRGEDTEKMKGLARVRLDYPGR